jgi:hypothetical protein
MSIDSNDREHELSEPAATIVLGLTLDSEVKQRMELLATRNGQGTLTKSERDELEAYVNIGQVLGVVQAKARLSLKRATGN